MSSLIIRRMNNIKPVQLRVPSSRIFLTQCRSISASKCQCSSAQPPPPLNQSDQDSKNKTDWDKFLPVARQLIKTFGAFYNRSTDLDAAKKWEELKAQGYRPAKRSKVNFRWWHEERQRGRIQADHEQSYPLFRPEYAPLRRPKNSSERRPSSFQGTVDQRRRLTTSAVSYRHGQNSPFNPRLQPPSNIHHKNSPDIIDVVGDAATFEIPDLDYTSLDSDSGPDTSLYRHLGESPGAKGIRGLRPGSLLELRRTNQSELGILVQTQGNGVVYINRAGEIRLSILDNVMYTSHGVVPEDVASRTYDENFVVEGLNDAITPASSSKIDPEEMNSKGKLILNARRDCCRALRALEKKLDKSHSILTQAGSYNLYYQFKHPDPQKSAHLTSEQGVLKLLGQQQAKDEIMVFALHQQLMANADMFLANVREMRDGSSFFVQPFHTLTALYTVREWIAQNSEPLKTFVEKCKSTIQAHRSQQANTNPEAPLSYALLTFAQWTPTDCMFIEVFRTIAINQRMIQDQPYSAIAAYILKEIGLYDSEAMAKTWPSLTFDRFGAITLLRDLGILPAWQSVGLWNPDLDLTERISQQFNSKAQSSSSFKSVAEKSPPIVLPSSRPSKSPVSSQRPPQVSSDDPADSLRHDFGDLPVYIVDDPGAQELDDGISIECFNQETGEAWIHVHIADPTSHLSPSDDIALQARTYLDTVYLPGFTLPMLPSNFIETHRMSLGSNDKSTSQAGQKTLSFSARINENGEIVEYKVRPGWINNTKQVTYQVVSEILDGPGYSDQARVLHIGPDAGHISSAEENSHRNLSIEELDQDDLRRIKQLGKISRILTKKRVDDGALGWHLQMAEVSIRPNPIVSPSLGIPLAPRIIAGTPSLSISLPPKITNHEDHSWGMSSSQALVSEMMIMAGRLAGRFYVDESIKNKQDFKLAFRSQPPPDLISSTHNQEALKELRKQIDPKTGLLSPFKFQKSRMMFMPAVNGLEPMNHFPLGINDEFGYCKVTSPLRRYSDLVAHWQIKNALLRSQGKKVYQDKKKILSLDGMKQLISRLDRDSKPMVNLDRKMNLSWMCYILRRIMKDQKTTINSIKIQDANKTINTDMNFIELVNNNLSAIILQDPVLMKFTNRWSFKAYIPELGLRASLIIDEVQDWFSSWVEHQGHIPTATSITQPVLGVDSSQPALDNDPIGLRVPVKIVYINPEDHLILRLDSTRNNFVIHSIV